MYKTHRKKLNKEQKYLRRRILELSFNSRLSHLGSCLTAVDLIDAVYEIKKAEDKFVLSNGHAGIAWYTVLEKYGYIKSPQKITNFHIHPDRNIECKIHVSTGSLGQGLPIALGMALANRHKNLYCMLSDGECAEGSIWEAFRVIYETKAHNLKIVINANGWSAYDRVNLASLVRRIKGFGFKVQETDGHDSKSIIAALKEKNTKKPTLLFAYTEVEQFPFLKGQDAHYYVMKQDDYDLAMQLLE